MAVSSTTGGLRTGVCLSTDRPQNPYNGQVIYETDTNRTLIYDNSAWVVISDPSLLSYSGTGATVTADAMTVAGENVTPYTGRRNLLYNGAMQISQRGTSTSGITSAPTGEFVLDRWCFTTGGMGAWTLSQESDVPPGFNNSIKLLCTTAEPSPAATTYLQISQRLEGLDVQCMGYGTSEAKSTTMSFWVKSNLTGTYICRLYTLDTSRAVHKSITVNSADTWEYKSVTFPGDTSSALGSSNVEGLRISIWLDAGTTFTQSSPNETWGSYSSSNTAGGVSHLAATLNNYIQFTGVQLELGDKATPFEHRSYGEELALCQRYYYETGADGSFQPFGVGVCTTSTQLRAVVPFPVEMRVSPDALITTGTASDYVVLKGGPSGISCTSVSWSSTSKTNAVVLFDVASGLNSGEAAYGRSQSTSAYLAWSAEL